MAALAALLSSLPRDSQVLVLGLLGERGDATVAPAVAALTGSEAEEVRAAAVAALGSVGNASSVSKLLDAALRRALRSAEPKVRAEAARAVASRRSPGAFGDVIALPADPDGSVRALALTALGALATLCARPCAILLGW